MPEKAKAAKPWLVLKGAGDGLLSKLYSGPDRKKAREAAEKALASDKDATVTVVRCSVLETLVAGDLKASLPRDAFWVPCPTGIRKGAA